ncbi:hypothetical protein ACLGIH_20395 [Streptomyces sp. HMX87]|uniref:hypothetical protein n=1 Tax=Streptomyces sp. HMX87 TaxID=3390849 RepID=UPI003A84E97E
MTRARRYPIGPRPELTEAEKAEREAMNQPRPRVRSEAERKELAARVRELQQVDRPLTTAELVPGLWVRMQYVNAVGKPAGSRVGLLAEDYREPDRLVLWSYVYDGFPPGANLVLGPTFGRDREMPTHEMRPVDPSRFREQERAQIAAYAERGRWNRDKCRWELEQ